MRVLAFVVLGLALATAPANAFAQDETTDISRCVIEVDGKVWQDGLCSFEAREDGSFFVSGQGTAPTFAYVDVAQDGLPPMGVWNGVGRDSHAHDRLGELRQDGACWVNDRARVCAWQ